MTTDATIEKKKATSKKLQVPKKWKVIFCNDDVTPMTFVIAVLVGIFNHDEKTATHLTMDVHNKGSAIVGIYNFEIAEQKAIDATNVARANGYPLVIKVEEE